MTGERYRKKPVEITAVRYDGTNGRAIREWAGEHVREIIEMHAPLVLAIYTLEGVMKADIGDWVIRGVQGEFYPCKPDIFAATYDPEPAQPEAALSCGGSGGEKT